MVQNDKYKCAICDKKFKYGDSIARIDGYYVHSDNREKDCLTVAMMELLSPNFITYEELKEED